MSLRDAKVYIPIADSDEVVVVPVDQLPADSEELLDIFRAEQPPLSLWLDLAKAYLSQGNEEQFLHVLEEGATPEVEEFYQTSKYERIQILCALGGYHTNAGKRETGRKEKDQHWNKATAYLNSAGRIEMLEQLPWVGKGLLALAKGDLEAALKHFQRAVEISGSQAAQERGEKDNISGLLGIACVFYNQKKFAEALSYYKQALRKHPGAPAHVRLGLAACYVRLDNADRAARCFQRVLDLDPSCTDAAVGLALLKINSADEEETREGLRLLSDAFKANPRHPLMLNLLADHYFIRDEPEKVRKLARAAFEATDNPQIKARSCFHQARTFHAEGGQQEAEKLYAQATQLDTSDPLPHYGLGQLYALRGTAYYRNAVAEFENVLKVTAGNVDAHKALGSLFPRIERADSREKAIANLREAMVQSPRDVEMKVALGELLALGPGAQEAIQCFEEALKLCRSGEAKSEPYESGGATPELANNTAVMLYMVGRLDEAEVLYAEALGLAARAAGLAGEGEEVSAESLDLAGARGAELITLVYNVARLREAKREWARAAALYRRIAEAQPNYVDCYIRLAAMARAKGALPEATAELERAVTAAGTDTNVQSMMGTVAMGGHDWEEAKRRFEAVREDPSTHHDAYATLGLGNLNLYTAPLDAKPSRPGGGVERLESHLSRALDLYHRVLQREPRNYWAANGVGAIMAQRGRLSDAKDIFTVVQESSAADVSVRMPDVWVNLAHVLLAQGAYTPAIKMYQNVLKKFFWGQDAAVTQCLARAHYEASNLRECKGALLRAMHLDPTNHQLRFDLGYTMQEFAVRTLKRERRDGDTRKLAEFEEAVSELRMAVRFFKHLAHAVAEDPRHLAKFDITEKKTASHLEFCIATLEKARQYVEHARAEEARAEAARGAQLKRLQAAAEAQKAMELAQSKEAEALRVEQEERARQQAERLKAMKEEWRLQANMPGLAEKPERKKKSAGGGGGDAFLDDDPDLLEASKEGQLVGKGGKKGKKGGGGEKGKKSVLAAAGLDTSSDEDNDEGGGAESEGDEGEYKSDDGDGEDSAGSGDEEGGEKKKESKKEKKAALKAEKAARKAEKERRREEAKAAKKATKKELNALIRKKQRDEAEAMGRRDRKAEEAEAEAMAGVERAEVGARGEGEAEGGSEEERAATTSRKLKRAAGGEEGAGGDPEGDGDLGDDLEDDDEGGVAGAGGGADGGEGAGPPRKRARGALVDSDEDE